MEAAIEFHDKSKVENNDVCLFGKYHNILYVAAKLCYQWALEETDIVCALLTSVYACEKTFEKFFECSIFGTKVTQLISGWRSDYCTQDENINASVYFLKHAVKGRLKFTYDSYERNFIDVPMHCYENLSPLKTAVKADKWDLAILLIKYGAITFLPATERHHEMYSIFRLFIQKLEQYDSLCYCRRNISECFKIYIRSIPTISVVWESENKEEDTWPALMVFLEEMGLENGGQPRSLKHLARCTARRHLAEHHKLPAQFRELAIPQALESYLNLETD